MNDSTHAANACHQCGEEMDHFKPPTPGSYSIGICPEHGVSYGKDYTGPGSIYGSDA